MKIYIRSSACISAQKTFGNSNFLDDIVGYSGTRLGVIEPDYKEYIDPKVSRRMSKIIKLGIAAAKQCLLDAGVEMPGAVITGTALGCIEDTVTFITRIVEQNEEMLPPTAFIQSTHNTVAAQVALMLKCHAYNSTFVHKGISFESALFDAVMILNEGEADNILVGGTDELVNENFTVLTRLGLYKRWPVSNMALFSTESKGTIGGEGTAFFLLTDKPSDDNLAELTCMKTFYNQPDIKSCLSSFLKENSLRAEDIDLVLTGRNGDIKNDAVYKDVNTALFKNNALANYKHLCGEYPVSTSFALWLASNIIKKGIVPEVVFERKVNGTPPKKILIYNHYQNKYHSLMVVSAV